MGRFRGRGPVRNYSRFSAYLTSKVWRERCGSFHQRCEANSGRRCSAADPGPKGLFSRTAVLFGASQSRRSLFAEQESRAIAPITCSTVGSINASERGTRSSRNGHLASCPSNIEPSSCPSNSVRAPPSSRSDIRAQGPPRTANSRVTHGSEGMTVSAHSMPHGEGTVRRAHACYACMAPSLTLRPSVQRRYSRTCRRNKVLARS